MDNALYESVERLIGQEVFKAHQRDGGDFDEMMSLAGEVFCKAWHGHDDRSKFSTWLVRKLRCGFMEYRRCRRDRAKDYDTSVDVNDAIAAVSLEPFDSDNFSRSMSMDADYIIGMLTRDCDEDWDRRVLGKNPAKSRKAIARYLKQEGWSQYRIGKAFKEIKEKLGDGSV